ncbi:MAG TPA: hypothetical protein ENH91_03695 [Leeuwenhoekiella sp.]|nr:hypothetical protein [Leeuwenhoekiella sp.]
MRSILKRYFSIALLGAVFILFNSFSNYNSSFSKKASKDYKTPFTLRINSGGGELIYGNQLFVKDAYYTGDSKVFENKGIKDIGNTGHDALYLTERSTLKNKNTFNYAIPVPKGTFKVILHFAEIYWGASNGGPGGGDKRIFNVNIENKQVLTNLDINKEVGSMNALQKEYTVNVDDGILNIYLKASKDQPKISALEIIEKSTDSNSERVYINTGGPQVEVNGKLYSADNYYTGGRSFTNYGISDIGDTNEDIIYKSERSTGTGSGGFSYNIPVSNGDYQVKVHLAEIYWDATGGARGGMGKRLINLSLENKRSFSNLDIIKEVGAETALIKTFDVTVSDGILNIDLTASKDEPKIAAIEIDKKPNVEETVVARINAGSDALTINGKTFQADTYFTGSTTVYQNPKIGDITNTTEDELYKTERSAGENKGTFGYAIPVEYGTYRIALHFAEIYWGATGGGPGGANKRNFSVAIENNQVLEDYDMYEELGAMTAAVKTYKATVNDGLLNIDFTASIDRPKIAAIEVFKENETPEDELPLIASFNAGGPDLELDGTLFQEDAYFRGTSKTSTTTFTEIKNTDLDDLYKTERSADNNQGSFSYDFPVTNGTYQVKLHFAEIWFGAPQSAQGGAGKRVFDVDFENENRIDDLDITNETGAGTALVKTYEVNVSDGELNIDFSASIDRPQLCAIQLYGNGELGEEGQDPCQWKELAPSGLEKLESQSAKVGDKLYTFAGFLSGFIITGETEIYDVNNDIWSKGAPMPTPVTHVGKAVVNDNVWIIGGFTGNDPGVATDKVQIYNTTSDTWRAGPSLPAPRGSGAATYNNGKIHYFGGLLPDRVTDVDEHYILDPENLAAGWVPAAPLPLGRNHLSAARFSGSSI